VGGSNIESTGYYGKGGWGVYANEEPPSKSKASVMNRGGTRCNNCPGKGCYACPLYPVGEHPTYLANKAKREEKRAKRKAKKAQATNCIEQLDISVGTGAYIQNEDFSSLFSDDLSSFSDDSYSDFTEETTD
jgi:hypothetical protein